MASIQRNNIQQFEHNLKIVLSDSIMIKESLSEIFHTISVFSIRFAACMLMPSITKALLEDERFKKQCLSQIAKQFDINQVFQHDYFAWTKHLFMTASFQHSNSRKWSRGRRHEQQSSPKNNFWS